MQKHHEQAKRIFERYSKKDELHFTSDGQAFFEPNPAQNHAKNLTDKTVIPVKRHEVAEIAASEPEEEKEADKKEPGDKDAAKSKKADEKAKEEPKA